MSGGAGTPTGSGPDSRFDGGDAGHMRRAVELAARGWGRTPPNPLVGAVVVREGRAVAEGFHAEFGGPHAEVVALREAGDAARGATLYVSLEPCHHEGKTPRCTDAILRAGIARVVYACPDPDPAAGGGAASLRAAGVEVRGGVEAESARRLNAPFFWRHAGHESGAPFVALKLALSLDGRLAGRPGARTSLTGPEARREVHRLRAGYDAVLVGRRTVEVDDPRLTARGDLRPRRPPVRLVLDSELRLDPGSRLARTTAEAPVWAVAATDAAPARASRLEGVGVRVLRAPRHPGEGLELGGLSRRLREEGIASVLVEGGARVASSFLRSGLVRRCYLFYAPLVLGPEGVPAFTDAEAWTADGWNVVERRGLGRDTLIVLEARGLGAELAAGSGDDPGRAGC